MRRLSRSNSPDKVADLKNKKEEKLDNVPKGGKLRLRLIKKYLMEYTANSNLHGLKYIGEKDRTPIEKIFWFIMFICCVVICSTLIRKVWIKWNESPVIVTFSENSTPVWQIPYPAVTICSETKSNRDKLNFTKYVNIYLHDNETTKNNLTEEEINEFEDVSMVCDDRFAPTKGRRFSLGNATVETIRKVSPNISDMFLDCNWRKNNLILCEDIFFPILTEEGLCYSFNILPPEQLLRLENLHKEYKYLEVTENTSSTWSLEGGYPPTAPLETYPHRGSGYGAKAGLEIMSYGLKSNVDFLCKGPVQGFKILLHNPAELPRLSQQYFRLPFDQEVVVAVKPKMMTTSEGLRPYAPKRRQCYFPSERYLRYFKVYTQANCEMECVSNYTFKQCGCVHFGMPRGPNMNVCNAGSRRCIEYAEMDLMAGEILSGINRQRTDATGEAHNVAAKCRCLPACTSIEYEAETSQSDFEWTALYKSFNIPDAYAKDDNFQVARLLVYFKEAQFISSRRSELYGQTDFLANCGGLLGLFMGFSILSVAEIVYFMTLRLCCHLKTRTRRISLKQSKQQH